MTPRSQRTLRIAGEVAFIAASVVCGAAFVSGCAVEPVAVRVPGYFHPSTERKDVSRRLRLETDRADALRRGATVYRDACLTCHGARGDGLGASAEPLDPPPWDFTMGAFMAAESAGETLEEGIFQVISEGVPETSMEGFGRLLSPEDRWAVTLYVLQLSEAE